MGFIVNQNSPETRTVQFLLHPILEGGEAWVLRNRGCWMMLCFVFAFLLRHCVCPTLLLL